jgi:DNA-directed RNA polymerase specialized sigma24 family protein
VEDTHQAEEVTQAVFSILAKKAGSLRPGTVLAGWLYETARLTARNHARWERRRQHYERKAIVEALVDINESDLWARLAPLLDRAMGQLRASERCAVVLRFFEAKNFKEIGRVLGRIEIQRLSKRES